LTQKHATNRLKWAKAHRHWTVEDWRKVAWSDECAVQKNSDPRQLHVFRRQNKEEKYAIKNIQPKSRDGYISQIIWVCFVGNKLGPIAFVKGMVNKDTYIDIVQNTLLPFFTALTADGLTNIVFQQDNASPHTAKKTKQFLDAAARTHGFSVMAWPVNSPDMNLIEQLWAHLKLELHRRYSDTKLAFRTTGARNVDRILQVRILSLKVNSSQVSLSRSMQLQSPRRLRLPQRAPRLRQVPQSQRA